MGAPYELWVGSDATVGTSVGQVRVVDMEGSELMFDMFHSYQEGGELNGRRFFFCVLFHYYFYCGFMVVDLSTCLLCF